MGIQCASLRRVLYCTGLTVQNNTRRECSNLQDLALLGSLIRYSVDEAWLNQGEVTNQAPEEKSATEE